MKFYKIISAKAPINIAIIKYWGKRDENLKIPINDSISTTLGLELSATTSVEISDQFTQDELWLNELPLNLQTDSQAQILLQEIRKLSPLARDILDFKVHIKSFNNFPTAAGLASSAAGYACMAFVLGHAYGVTDLEKLSILARRGSGSACRSLYGGFVRWKKGHDNESSKAEQIVDEKYWDLRVIICVVNHNKKEIPSSLGMLSSVKTSALLAYRANTIVPQRVEAITKAIISRDFQTFADITMQDSNQFHAICLDTYPPICYLNDVSRHIIKLCTLINRIEGRNVVAYTFDAGPNACIYSEPEFATTFISLMDRYFKHSEVEEAKLELRGMPRESIDDDRLNRLVDELDSSGLEMKPSSISYLIQTSIGSGPRLLEQSDE